MRRGLVTRLQVEYLASIVPAGAVLSIPEVSADGDSRGASHSFFVVVNKMASLEKRLWTSATKRQREMHLQVSLQRMQCAHGPV